VAQAKPICVSAASAIDAVPELPTNDKAGAIRVLNQRAGVVANLLTQLKALTPPAGEASISQWMGDLQKVVDDSNQEVAAYQAGDTVKAAQLEARFDNDETRAKTESSNLGLGDCGA
jgi:hypothetical protein